ncbi:acyltransferase [Poseidonocella sp. HB161398]|uniref:acyltransferase family protein n=1 Tax=Poseidonocella sp. HB161398 TaxID=2320855 RepID=UPI001108D5E3|nr:acyltransferase [Poseidonocella sp. HB161398]
MTGGPAVLRSLSQARSPLLDCIRAVAIILVVFFHVAARYPGQDGLGEHFFQLRGSKGVDLFFPLSGFLITSFLLQSRRPDFVKVFFLRRVFRILPLYMAMVTLALASMTALGEDPELVRRIWINYTFLTSWFIHFQGQEAVPYTVTWSLSVEEFSYILFGLAALASRRALPAVLLAFSVAPFFLKLWYVSQGAGFYFMPLARIDSIAIGGVAAWLMITGRRPLLWLSLAMALCYALAASRIELRHSLTLVILALWTSLAMVAISRWARQARNPLISAGASIGFHSYFTYLFHVFVIEAVFLILPRTGYPPFLAVAVLCLGATHAAALLSYRWFEAPLMQWGRRFEGPAPAPEAALPEPAAPEDEAGPARPLRS